MTINDIVTGITTRTISVLGADYKKANYGIDFLKNTNKGNSKIYAVLPQNLNNSTTVTRSVTYDQEFLVRLGNSYINKSMSDALQQQVAIDLLELGKDLYKDLVDTKCGVPAICLNVSNLSIEDPINITESKMVAIEMTFIVKYRELI